MFFEVVMYFYSGHDLEPHPIFRSEFEYKNTENKQEEKKIPALTPLTGNF